MSGTGTGADVEHAARGAPGGSPAAWARLRELADEQAALRRVATLVASGARPAEVFRAVADELGRLIGAEATFVSSVDLAGGDWLVGSAADPSGERPEPEGYITVLGSYGRVGRVGDMVPVGFRRELRPALRALGRHSAVPVEVDVRVGGRLPEPVEVAAYYLVSEMLTNAVKHARASVVKVDARSSGGMLQVRVRDDGIGGADPARGSGLIGLKDRIEAMGGTFSVHNPVGHGTTVTCELPATADGRHPGAYPVT